MPGTRIHGVETRDRKEVVARPLVDVDHQHLQHQGKPEDRCREPKKAQRRARVVEHGILVYGRVDADPDSDQKREHLGDHDELQRVAHDPCEVGEDRPVADRGRAELVRDGVLEPVQVLHKDRIVQVLPVCDVLERQLGHRRVHLRVRERISRRPSRTRR